MTDRPAVPAAVFYLAGALVYLSFGFTEMMGSDLWWHLAVGRSRRLAGARGSSLTAYAAAAKRYPSR